MASGECVRTDWDGSEGVIACCVVAWPDISSAKFEVRLLLRDHASQAADNEGWLDQSW